MGQINNISIILLFFAHSVLGGCCCNCCLSSSVNLTTMRCGQNVSQSLVDASTPCQPRCS